MSQKAKTEKPEKNPSFFTENNFLSPKICAAVKGYLNIALVAFCVLQILIWGIFVARNVAGYGERLLAVDVPTVAFAVITMFFLVCFIVSVIKSLIAVIKKDLECPIHMVCLLFSFFCFSEFAASVFGSKALLFTRSSFLPVLYIVLALVACYAVIRLFDKDFSARIAAFLCGCAGILVAVAMYSLDVGSFAIFTVDGHTPFSLSELNVFQYLQTVIGQTDMVGNYDESLLFTYGNAVNISYLDMNEEIVWLLLQVLPIFAVNLLPFAALSLIGYLLRAATKRNFLQYRELQACKSVSVTMLILSLLSFASVVVMQVLCKVDEAYLSVEILYGNTVLSIVLCIAMVVLTSVPWKLYNAAYNRRYEEYQASEEGI